MKIIITILLSSILVNASAQKIALIDRDFKKPILFTDSVTVNQITLNYFPVEVAKLDSFVANLKHVIKRLEPASGDVHRSKIISFEVQAGNTAARVSRVHHAYGDSYDVFLISDINNISAEFKVARHEDLGKKNRKKIRDLIDYLKRDKSLVIDEYKDYNIVELKQKIYVEGKN